MDGINPKVDNYLAVGCGRCPLGGTPDCKVHLWPDELTAVRRILQETDLTEDLKWGVPCYTYDGHNVAMLSALKGFCSLSFFKGVLLKDPEDILVPPGPNSQSDRLIRFTDVERCLNSKRSSRLMCKRLSRLKKRA